MKRMLLLAVAILPYFAHSQESLLPDNPDLFPAEQDSSGRSDSAGLLPVVAGVAPKPDFQDPELNPATMLEKPVHAPLELFRGGRCRFILAFAKAGPAKEAAERLREAFWRATGVVPPMTWAGNQRILAKHPIVLYVGQSPETKKLGIDMEKLPPGGFLIKTAPNAVALVGYDSHLHDPGSGIRDPVPIRGTLDAVYEFMERFLGVRFYYPGEIGTIRPRFGNLTIEPVCYMDYPRFANRNQSYFMTTPKAAFWDPILYPEDMPTPRPPREIRPAKDHMNHAWRQGCTLAFRGKHAPNPGDMASVFRDRLQDVFFTSPLTGEMYYDREKQSSLCCFYDVTSLKLADLLVEEAVKLHNGEESGIYRTQGDITPTRDVINFGQCDRDAKTEDIAAVPVVRELGLLSGNGRDLRNVYGRFYHYMASRLRERAPGMRLIVLAYANYKRPPDKKEYLPLPDNLDVFVCCDLPGMIVNEDQRAWALQLVSEWVDALGGRPVPAMWWYAAGSGVFARAYTGEYTGQAVRLLGEKLGRKEIFYDHCGDMNWSFYYSNNVMNRSLWNPDFDGDAAIAAHWIPFYGPEAGPLLKEFHDLGKKAFEESFKENFYKPAPIPSETTDRMRNLLKTAMGTVGEKSVEARRIRIFALPWLDVLRMKGESGR